MKQVDKRPTEGQFIAIWEYDGKSWAHTFKYIDGDLHFFDRDFGEWFYSSLTADEVFIDLDVTYFIAEPALKEITFKEDYELLKWLKDNAGEYLYSDETKSIKAYWINATGLGGYRVEDFEGSVTYLINTHYLQQKRWYHY